MRLVLLGDPVGHSTSPAMHNAALAAVGIEGLYEARRVDAAGVYRACAEIRSGALHGANVTMPHKRVAAAAADRLLPLAHRAGAVNTLWAMEGEVVGDNTDAGALPGVWAAAGLPAGSPVLVLGAGGAAAAVLAALGGARLAIAARRAGAGAALAGRLGIEAEEVPWGDPLPGAVVVNSTPLGREGESLPAGVVEESAGLYDLPCRPGGSPAVLLARGRGLPVADGWDHLVAQGALSFTRWTGLPAPIEVMRRAATGE
ncbi:MAG: shikimate dehydrogenase [Acidimicrobiia bacterium]|nr:shikimate dehydrogenase [Acidimicrobiia bacterium]